MWRTSVCPSAPQAQHRHQERWMLLRPLWIGTKLGLDWTRTVFGLD